ncbi:dTDP-4-amino-4,6-dideoxygalactose transaminase [Flavobacteriaceae bacterium MAR_2010_188]|nr:dTDP-4-amino-4,6-dideoxygalactose transaminase [Flavobacteriaceae bacterium MAR_2010_188]
MKSRIFLSPPHMSGFESDFIKNAFDSNFVAPGGENVNVFEDLLEDFVGENNHVAVLNSGTSALHLALIMLNVEADDEVICQSNSFVATANPILYQGAIPVFVDSEMDTYNMCPILLKEAIIGRIQNGKKPKAIIMVHIYGMPCKFDEIKGIADSYEIPVIEDSAEALGSKYKSKACGTLGECGIFSFNGNKIITTSAGGALVTKSSDLKKRALYLASQAKLESLDYLHEEIGYNYRMSNILASIGIAQMKVLNNHIQKRRENFDFYQKSLPNLEFLPETSESFSNRWLTTAVLETNEQRNNIINGLRNENIECRPMWKPLHTQPLYSDFPKYINGVSEDLNKRGICLPSGSNLTLDDLERIILAVSSI